MIKSASCGYREQRTTIDQRPERVEVSVILYRDEGPYTPAARRFWKKEVVSQQWSSHQHGELSPSPQSAIESGFLLWLSAAFIDS